MPPERGREKPGDRTRVQHMLDAAKQAREFVQGRSRAELDSNTMLARALTNAVQEIGEAANNVTEEARARMPDVPWREMVAMRNFLVHVYFGVNLEKLWKTVEDDLPPLIAALERAVATWPPDAY